MLDEVLKLLEMAGGDDLMAKFAAIWVSVLRRGWTEVCLR